MFALIQIDGRGSRTRVLNRLAVAAVASVALLPVSSRADTIFEVEHARANDRAGLVSEYDAELLRRWGRLSGNYPAWRFPDYNQVPRYGLKKRVLRARR